MGDCRGCSRLQIFAKIEILPIDHDSEKKKEAKIIWTTLNSSKTTGNMCVCVCVCVCVCMCLQANQVDVVRLGVKVD